MLLLLLIAAVAAAVLLSGSAHVPVETTSTLISIRDMPRRAKRPRNRSTRMRLRARPWLAHAPHAHDRIGIVVLKGYAEDTGTCVGVVPMNTLT